MHDMVLVPISVSLLSVVLSSQLLPLHLPLLSLSLCCIVALSPISSSALVHNAMLCALPGPGPPRIEGSLVCCYLRT
jgi:hypothetical protein